VEVEVDLDVEVEEEEEEEVDELDTDSEEVVVVEEPRQVSNRIFFNLYLILLFYSTGLAKGQSPLAVSRQRRRGELPLRGSGRTRHHSLAGLKSALLMRLLTRSPILLRVQTRRTYMR
jgi:hypothetical protein